jgi:Flp pilus assembly protein TadB
MNTALAAFFGLLICGGTMLIVAGFRSVPAARTHPRLLAHSWQRAATRRRSLQLVLALLAGCAAAGWTGLPMLAAIVPAAAFGLPVLLSTPVNRDAELLEALDRWVRNLAALLPTGRSITDAVRVSARQAPALLGPDLRLLVARLDDRWTIEQALTAMAESLGSADADAILAALILAAERGGTGATATLNALADTVQDRLRALREIETERAKPRIVVRQVTIFTVAALGLALLFGGSFFAPFGSLHGQFLLTILVIAYLGSLLFLRRMALPRPRQRILRRAT